MKIFISLDKSNKPLKKYVFIYKDDDGKIKKINFGSKNSSTYNDHHNKHIRDNYLNRHRVNEDWSKINAGSLSAYLLWGTSIDIYENLINYLNKFNILHDFNNENDDY
jgi:hypothetical protein